MYKLGFVLLLGISACRPSLPDPVSLQLDSPLVIPEGFPEIEFPEDNAFSEARWELGKAFFYDVRLSRDQSISCASCHQPDLAFADHHAVSLGVGQRMGTRNAPSLANVAYHPYLTREGGVPSLEMQVLVPVQEHAEFDFNILLIAERLQTDSLYQKMSWDAYERELDFFVLTRALATFERSLISGNSPYDVAQRANNEYRLSRKALKGQTLFFSDRTACSQCHSGFNFTNYTFENNGLYEEYPDPGRFHLSGKESDRARFKVPSLRNVAMTPPYMHDGSLTSLEEVIDHYNSGGQAHPHKSSFVRPMDLSSSEKEALIAFLYSLTDYAFVSDPKFLPHE